MNRIDRFAAVAAVSLMTLAGTGQVLALTKEQAIENCRNTVGRPIVQACMCGRRDSGNIEQCCAQTSPKVKACVIDALNKANGRANVAVPVPKEPAEPAAAAVSAAPAAFVAPPRTIADITAVLDSEKPDPEKIAAIKAAAEAVPPAGASREKLAKFYYDRGNARAALGRLNDATVDANKALELGRGAVELNLLGRLQQFVGLQYSAAGDPKRALEVFDPFFSKEQMQAAADEKALDEKIELAMATTRGIPLKRRASPQLEGVDSAELALLPRLPDTAEELRSIAVALEADPSKVVQLGIKANEHAVKSMDLSRYKVIVFATHGLVPGELNGLTQPALALPAPDVAGSEGDGLLTMEEILALRLDADWVVLSACNTGSGAGAGAEAASGLGRAFFYAGTRALLVTNWSVHSQSARDLTTDLFRRQNADQALSPGEALRQAMIALMDGPGFAGPDGKTAFAYAHPLFWAPYSIIGDGGI